MLFNWLKKMIHSNKAIKYELLQRFKVADAMAGLSECRVNEIHNRNSMDVISISIRFRLLYCIFSVFSRCSKCGRYTFPIVWAIKLLFVRRYTSSYLWFFIHAFVKPQFGSFDATSKIDMTHGSSQLLQSEPIQTADRQRQCA